MGRLLLICRLASRDLRHRPAQAVLLLLTIAAATTTLTLGLALHGVTSHPYQQTRAATAGPDLVAQMFGPGLRHGPGVDAGEAVAAQARTLEHARGVTAHSGPYPVASVLLRYHDVRAGAEAEGRGQAPAGVEQPKLTAGNWVRPGGVVIERTFADALGVGVGDRVTLAGRAFTVTGLAVTAASPPYPNLCYTGCVFTGGPVSSNEVGLVWVTGPAARSLASASPGGASYVLNLRLRDPASAAAFAGRYDSVHSPPAPYLVAWQSIRAADGLLVTDEQQVLMPGSWLVGLLAVASVAVLAGGRMAEANRRTGLLKAAGGTPGLAAAALLAENLLLALAAAAAGLVAGWLAAPLLTSPGAGLVGAPGAPPFTAAMAGEVVAVSVVVALAATGIPSLRAARTATVAALAGVARPPRRRAMLIAVSARLPVPLLLGLRLAARRPRRALLTAASIAVTSTGIVAVLAFHATVGERRLGASSGLANPVVQRDSQMLAVLTVVLVALAVLNTVVTAWATVLDTRQSSGLARALGASPRQVSAGLSAAQVVAALPGAIAGVPLGIGLFAVANSGGIVTVPPVWSLAAAVIAVLAAVAVLTAVPARVGTRRSAAVILQQEG